VSKLVWKKLDSLELVPSAITLRDYDGRPSSPEGIFQNVPVELGGKIILIDIEVIDAPLDYNILFGRSYMYSMKVVSSSMFHMMIFPIMEKSSSSTNLHITSIIMPPTLITFSPLFALALIPF
jgi:hypothetical protein